MNSQVNDAVKRLEHNTEEAEAASVTHVAVKVKDARRILDYIRTLTDDELQVGDTVVFTDTLPTDMTNDPTTGPGTKAKIMDIHVSHTYPYRVLLEGSTRSLLVVRSEIEKAE